MKPLQLTKSMQSAKLNWRQILFAGLLTGSLFCSPVVTLFAGILFALTLGNPFPVWSKKASKKLLQYCVVGLGFGMNFHESLAAGREGMTFTVVSVVTVMIVGVVLGRLLRIDRKNSYLISSGTAICGGSAIAAVAPVIDADENQTSLSLATIFILNAVALFVFPVIGHWLGMGQTQFGTWAAIAIHDTSSVVGAGAAYGEEALKVATTVKLTRALWIIPPVAGVGPDLPSERQEDPDPLVHLLVRRCHARKHLLQPADPAHARHFGRRTLRTFGHAVPDRRRALHRGNPQGRPQAAGAGHHPLGRHLGRIARRDLALVGSIRLP